MHRTLLLSGFALLVWSAAPFAEVASRASSDDLRRMTTSRPQPRELPLPAEDDAFTFAVFGDRTGGPAEGVEVLARAVEEVNLVGPDLVMTVGDLVQGYNQEDEWMEQMREYRGIMDSLVCPWFPVAGNHDIYWRGPEGERPAGEHEASYERHFGPLWYAFRHKDALFVALYSDEGDPASGRKSFSEPVCQRMSPEQLGWLERTLEEAASLGSVFVFLHHPRWLGGGYGDDWERVHQVLARAGNVRAVFGGHIHRMRYDGERDGIEYFSLATVGGHQNGFAPEAGYLHHYFLVTVRDESLSVASFPVGSAADPRAVTGAISDAAAILAQELRPRFDAPLALDASLAPSGKLAWTARNPVDRPIELFVSGISADSRWTFLPDHRHLVIPPGETLRMELELGWIGDGPDAAWRPPQLAWQADYLGEGVRIHMPELRLDVPLSARELPEPMPSATQSALLLDGVDDHVRVDDALLRLPDGPFTVETWMYASELRSRQGVVNKTEGCEFGLFAGDGVPELFVHLDGRYANARATEACIRTERWHHFAGVFDGAEIRVYVDGKRVASCPASGSRTRSDLPLLIGADVGQGGSANSHFRGWLDEVRVSKVARYTGERFEPERRHEADGDTVLLLHMDEAIAAWLYDSSPERAHPVALGGARVAPVR